MADRKIDDATGVETTGHEWDGIRELDNPLPRWWLWIWYATIAFSIGYWVLMPAWPGLHGYTKGLLNKSDRAEVGQELKALDKQRGEGAAMLRTASLEQIEKDPKLLAYAQQVGQSVFGDNCATCHGIGGTGSKGYANLRDDVWLWGGKLEDIQYTITHGVRTGAEGARMSQMPAFGRDEMLQPKQIDDLTEYVVSLSRRPADAAAVARAAPLFEAQCSACHGPQGLGNQELGAPNLTDADWLFGSDRASIRGQIYAGNGGVMPTWGGRLSPETIKALSVYIHSNAGGQ
ncbi:MULTISPECIES: cytochrome-c oxidase, cbb3-type subunit III [unclassified Caulobacter]|uniref:cytochrome-c oxidase, cbb3-type subunit III n=1 Tax=unclassified Caulobacter TaxID=2648921 RepID=UPI000781373B|nr:MULTISPECIES: cytochrome-c oxidase, cbb3-type subunit III [unclassified Caulobacter]AZS21543.1 cytochrome-c oxidase, cbb3-type subunit III [Caulobacter sp. FWC26]